MNFSGSSSRWLPFPRSLRQPLGLWQGRVCGQNNQPSSKTEAPPSSELTSADERSHLQPGLASRALAIAVAHGLLVFIDPPRYLRALGRWLLVWPLRVQVAPLCREVANAHRARIPSDLGAAHWFRGRGARLWLCGNAGSGSSGSSSSSD